MDWLNKERSCPICGNKDIVAIDDLTYRELCIPCNKRYVFDKQEHLDNFECHECGGLVGEIEENSKKFGIRCKNCGKLTIMLIKADKTIGTRNTNSVSSPEIKIRCPKCGSTNITTGARGFNIWTGFLGSGKTVNRCGSCGHMWKP